MIEFVAGFIATWLMLVSVPLIICVALAFMSALLESVSKKKD